MRGRLLFALERLALRGPVARIALVLGFLCLITLIGGAVASLVGASQFRETSDGLWWALLRVSDTGYLEDDRKSFGMALLSMVLSISGTAFLVGGVAAVMTQWLTHQVAQLAQGTRPVWYSNHVVVVGWSDRTVHVVRELLGMDRRERIVLLVNQDPQEVMSELALDLPRKMLDRVVLRSGLPGQPAHLARAAVERARAVVVPEFDLAAGDQAEHRARWLRWLAALRTSLQSLPPDEHPSIVVELADEELESTARRILPQARLVDGDTIVAEALLEGLESKGRRISQDGALEVLILGFTGGVPTLLREFAEVPGAYVVDVVADVEQADQMEEFVRDLDELGEDEARADHPRLVRRTMVADKDSQRALRELDLGRYDRFVLVGDRGLAAPRRADEATLATLIALSSLRQDIDQDALSVVELLDAKSATFGVVEHVTEVVTPREVGRALARTLRPQ